MKPGYTSIIQQRGKWWIGWIQEIAGVNAQGATREELLGNLSSALDEALGMGARLADEVKSDSTV